MIKAVIFDFGNTLVHSGFPLSWKTFYSEALAGILRCIELDITPDRIRCGEEVLLKYNTRVNPREHEVHANTIFKELFTRWGTNDLTKIKAAQRTFAAFFQNRSVLYEDSIPILNFLKQKGLKTGVLTNVAYGLDKELMMKGVTEISEYIDIFLASSEIGFRKPNPTGYIELTKRLDVSAEDCLFVGDEEVDVIGANRSGMVSVFLDRDGSNNQYDQTYTINNLLEIVSLLEKYPF